MRFHCIKVNNQGILYTIDNTGIGESLFELIFFFKYVSSIDMTYCTMHVSRASQMHYVRMNCIHAGHYNIHCSFKYSNRNAPAC